jgi:15-cis-phytoene synthase
MSLGEIGQMLPVEAIENFQTVSPDAALACGFIPPHKRDAITILYALAAEWRGITLRAREPLMGEVRLQWWREALLGERPDQTEVDSHPLSHALLTILREHHLPVNGLVDFIDCMMEDLYGDPPHDLTSLEVYCGQTQSILMCYASLILADGGETGPAAIAGPAGVAYALIGHIENIPFRLRYGSRPMIPLSFLQDAGLDPQSLHTLKDPLLLGQVVLPLVELAEQRFEEFKNARSEIPQNIRPAFALTGLVRPRLARLKQILSTNAFMNGEHTGEINPVAKIIRLWMAAVWSRV